MNVVRNNRGNGIRDKVKNERSLRSNAPFRDGTLIIIIIRILAADIVLY